MYFGAEVATLRFPYEPADIADSGFLEEFVVFVSNSGTDWERVERAYVETDGEAWFVVAETSHFSDFVVTAATAPSASSVTPAPGMDELFPDGIAGNSGAVFSLMDESFTYYQDRHYYIVPASESQTNATTFAELGLDGSVGISTFNGGSTGRPVSDHKHNTGLDCIRFTAHQDLDVYVMYDTRGGTGSEDTSEDAEWVRPGNGFDETGHKLETTDPVGLYTVYKKSFSEGLIVRLDGNWNGTGVDTTRIQTNYWVIINPKGGTESDSGSTIADTTEGTGSTPSATTLSADPFDTLYLTASVEPEHAANYSLSWSTEDSSVATVARVSQRGGEPDGDETPDFLVMDTDNDEITDSVEAFDADGNGIADVLAAGIDSNGDDLDDAYDPAEGGTTALLPDFDGDTIIDVRDQDDDGDGVMTQDKWRGQRQRRPSGLPCPVLLTSNSRLRKRNVHTCLPH